MKSIAASIGFFLLGLCITGYSQSLAEAAKKERERRAKLGAEAKVITNKDTVKYRNSPVSTGTPAPPASTAKPEGQTPGAPGTPETGKPKVDPTESTDFQGRPESFWRQTFLDARRKVTDLESEARVLTLKRAELQDRFFKESSGFRQQEVNKEIQKTIYEQELNKVNLAKAKEELADLEKEARKSGALPGWINPKP